MISFQDLNKCLTELNDILISLPENNGGTAEQKKAIKKIAKKLENNNLHTFRQHLSKDSKSTGKQVVADYRAFSDVETNLKKVSNTFLAIKNCNGFEGSQVNIPQLTSSITETEYAAGHSISKISKLLQLIHKAELPKIYERFRNMGNAYLGTGICLGHAVSMAVNTITSGTTVLPSKKTLREAAFHQAHYETNLASLRGLKALNPTEEKPIDPIKEKNALQKKLSVQMEDFNFDNASKKQKPSSKNSNYLDLAKSDQQNRFQGLYNKTFKGRSKIKNVKLNFTKSRELFIKALPSALSKLESGSYILYLKNKKNSHAIYIEIRNGKYSYCDTNDYDFNSAIPILSSFETLEEMRASLMNILPQNNEGAGCFIQRVEKANPLSNG